MGEAGGKSQTTVGGEFSPPIEQQRGVQQRCPAARLTLATHPLWRPSQLMAAAVLWVAGWLRVGEGWGGMKVEKI